MPSSELIEAIAATAELCNKSFSPAAARLFAADLDGYDERAVMKALTRCRKELKGPFTLEAVTSRIDDGRPGVEEAWSMVPHDEYKTVVWTDEMVRAWGIASPLIADGDNIGARMAFKEAYTKMIADARDQKEPVKWSASLGHDKNGRESVLVDAVQKGRLTANHVKALLPYHEITQAAAELLEKFPAPLRLVSDAGKAVSA